MVACCRKGIGDFFEEGLSVVVNLRDLSVHDALRPDHLSAEDFSNALVAETDPEKGDFAAEFPDHFIGNSRFLGRAGPRRDDDLSGLQATNLLGRDFIISIHDGVGSELAKVLNQVIGEGVVIINDQNHP